VGAGGARTDGAADGTSGLDGVADFVVVSPNSLDGASESLFDTSVSTAPYVIAAAANTAPAPMDARIDFVQLRCCITTVTAVSLVRAA
jgi:hypothetical protein